MAQHEVGAARKYPGMLQTIAKVGREEGPAALMRGCAMRIARVAGRLLRGIGLRPLLKTSGKTGIHVFVPLKPGYSYDHSRMFTEGIARVLARELGRHRSAARWQRWRRWPGKL